MMMRFTPEARAIMKTDVYPQKIIMMMQYSTNETMRIMRKD